MAEGTRTVTVGRLLCERPPDRSDEGRVDVS